MWKQCEGNDNSLCRPRLGAQFVTSQNNVKFIKSEGRLKNDVSNVYYYIFINVESIICMDELIKQYTAVIFRIMSFNHFVTS